MFVASPVLSRCATDVLQLPDFDVTVDAMHDSGVPVASALSTFHHIDTVKLASGQASDSDTLDVQVVEYANIAHVSPMIASSSQHDVAQPISNDHSATRSVVDVSHVNVAQPLSHTNVNEFAHGHVLDSVNFSRESHVDVHANDSRISSSILRSPDNIMRTSQKCRMAFVHVVQSAV